MSVNVGSLMSKLDSVKNFLIDESVHILGIGETWLVQEDISFFVALSGYVFIRSNRTGGIRKHGMGVYVETLRIEKVKRDVSCTKLYFQIAWL